MELLNLFLSLPLKEIKYFASFNSILFVVNFDDFPQEVKITLKIMKIIITKGYGKEQNLF